MRTQNWVETFESSKLAIVLWNIFWLVEFPIIVIILFIYFTLVVYCNLHCIHHAMYMFDVPLVMALDWAETSGNCVTINICSSISLASEVLKP